MKEEVKQEIKKENNMEFKQQSTFDRDALERLIEERQQSYLFQPYLYIFFYVQKSTNIYKPK